MITMQEIRERYPSPCIVGALLSMEDYCVGGAVCLFSHLNPSKFPKRRELTKVLLTLNYLLKEEQASQFAFDIISSNDMGNFEQSWQLVDDALTYGRL